MRSAKASPACHVVAPQAPRPSRMAGSHEGQARVPQLDSEVKLRFQVVGSVLIEEQPGLELPRPGFQPGYAPSLRGASSPTARGQAGGSPLYTRRVSQHVHLSLPSYC